MGAMWPKCMRSMWVDSHLEETEVMKKALNFNSKTSSKSKYVHTLCVYKKNL